MHPLRSPVRWRMRAALACLLAAGVTAFAPARAADADVQPEGATQWAAKPGWTHRSFAVAAANPLAADAGARILRAGGDAIDAAVAVQMVLGLVEPQSSGIGGGAFLLYHDEAHTEAYDGRETAPAAATESLFLDAQGKPLPFRRALIGGRSVGVPGALAMLEMAHRAHGRLPWKQLFAPAIELAERGFAVSPRMHALLAADAELKNDPVAAAYFFDANGAPWPAGHVLRNPEYAAVLRLVADRGARALYEGDVARAIVAKVQGHPGNPGGMTLADLQDYAAVERAPLCFDHRALSRIVRVCGMPPPSSGAIAIGEILGVLERTPAARTPLRDGRPDASWLHAYTEAARLAFADRAQYVGDPAFVPAPAGDWQSLVAPAYLDERARLVGPGRMPRATAGNPGAMKTAFASMKEQPEHGTSHVSIVDARGHALAMTTTIEAGWGSHLMVNRGAGLPGGFLLNNQLTDFSFTPRDAQGRPVANRVQPRKRPRSAMAPTLVFDKATGELLMSGGSPGGAMIIHFVAKTLWGVFDWGLDAQRAIDLPNFGSVSDAVMLVERGGFPAPTLDVLRSLGHAPREAELTSGLQAIERRGSGWFGGADPRREGTVAGD